MRTPNSVGPDPVQDRLHGAPVPPVARIEQNAHQAPAADNPTLISQTWITPHEAPRLFAGIHSNEVATPTDRPSDLRFDPTGR